MRGSGAPVCWQQNLADPFTWHKASHPMSLATVRSRALDGLRAPEVTVEVHLANGLPAFTLVGLADTEVKEARERVRAALSHAGLTFPNNKRVTVNLAPADLPKESGRFDLPIAIGILAALGEVDLGLLEGLEFAGELSLGGELRPVRGALAMALALRQSGDARRPRSLVLPMASAREAALVDGVRILGANRLLDVVTALRSSGDTGAQVAAEPCWTVVTRPEVPEVPFACGDLMDVRGQGVAKRALELAASAGHSLLMVGPPGTGKSMLAHRLASILPPLEVDDALESAAVLSLAGCFEPAQWRQRRVRAPLGIECGAGGGWVSATSWRGLAGPPRRAVPRRVARIPAGGPRGLARAPGDRADHGLQGGQAP